MADDKKPKIDLKARLGKKTVAGPSAGGAVPPPMGIPKPSGIPMPAFGKETKHEEKWTRTPNINGTGAIHVKTFHSKITDDALAYMDQQINEWLDAHPEYEVKFVSSTVGIHSGKLKEPHIICNLWV